MAEELAFQQIEGNGGAIQLHEWASAPPADVVNRARDQLFAGACFSLDQHGRIGRRYPLDLIEHDLKRRAITYDLLKSAAATILVTGSESFESFHRGPPGRLGTPLLLGSGIQCRSNTLEQGFIVERLGQELHCAGSQGPHPHFFVPMCGNEDDRNPAVLSV